MEQPCRCGAWQCDDCRSETSPFGDPLCSVCRGAWVVPGTKLKCQVCLNRRLNASRRAFVGVDHGGKDKSAIVVGHRDEVGRMVIDSVETFEKPPLGPPLVERELRCCTCRRLYCRVLAAADVTIVTLCEGCQREGR